MSHQTSLNTGQILDVLNLSKNATAIYAGNEIVIQSANDAMLAYWGKDRSVIGEPLEEAIPELKGQPFKKMLQEVMATGITKSGYAIPANLVVNGKLQTFFYDFEYRAIKNDAGETYCILHTTADVTERELNRFALQKAKKQEDTYNKALIESENNLRLVIKQAPVAIAIFRGPEYIVETVNARALQLWGRNESEVIHQPILEAMPELEEQGIKALLDRVYYKGERFSATELPIEILRNGRRETAFIDFVYEPLFDSDGAINGLITIGFEVTAQVAARKEIEQAEERMRMAIEAAELGTYYINVADRIFVASPRLKTFFGYGPDEDVPYEAAINQIHPDYRQAAADLVEAAITQRVRFDMEYPIIGHNDGKIRWVRGIGTVQEDADGVNSYFTGVLHEITEQVSARKAIQDLNEELAQVNEEIAASYEEQISVNEELKSVNDKLRITQDDMQLAIEAASLATFDLNPVTNTFTGNDLLKAWFGLNPEDEIELTKATDVIAEEDRERVMADIQRAMTYNSGGDYETYYTVLNPNNPVPRVVKAKGKALFNELQQPVRLSGVLQDITEMKADEQRKNDFIGMVSHELKTPLTSLTAIVQMADVKLRNSEDAFLKDAMSRANTQVKKMANLINGFLNVSRLESGKIHLSMQKFQLEKLLLDTVDELKMTVARHNFSLSICKIKVWADKDKIGSVITNFLTNAVKYSPNDATITVKCDLIDNKAVVSVNDEGIGIDQSDIHNLFDRYYRVESMKAKHVSGFGIGLYLSAEIIKRHNGDIWAESEPGKGSTFYFTLPLV